MTTNAAFLVAVIAAIVGALGAYLAVVRKLSGKIGTSEASQLWAESKAIRDEYRQRIDQSSIRTAALEERVARLEQVNNELRHENIDLQTKASDSDSRVLELQARLEALERENVELRKRVEELMLELHAERKKT